MERDEYRREERYLRELERDRLADYTPASTRRVGAGWGRQQPHVWSVVVKNEPVTWEQLARLNLATRDSRSRGVWPPIEFDVAVRLPRSWAERLQQWLAEHGVVAGVIETPHG